MQYHQETLDMLRECCAETGIFCAVLLDTKGPEIRTGNLEGGEPVYLVQGEDVTLTTDYTVVRAPVPVAPFPPHPVEPHALLSARLSLSTTTRRCCGVWRQAGNKNLIACSYPKLAEDVHPGNTILAADGSITLTVKSCNPAAGTIVCKCENNAKLGEKKNMNLPGVVVDLPTITEKDKDVRNPHSLSASRKPYVGFGSRAGDMVVCKTVTRTVSSRPPWLLRVRLPRRPHPGQRARSSSRVVSELRI